MPNIKSAKKRVKIIEKKTLRNNMIKSAYKSAVKSFEEAIEAGKIEEAKELFVVATKKIDQACAKGVIVKKIIPLGGLYYECISYFMSSR